MDNEKHDILVSLMRNMIIPRPGFVAICDICERNDTVDALTKTVASDKFLAKGWRIEDEDMLCPECSHNEGVNRDETTV